VPSKSPAQHRFMAAVAHNPAFAKKAGVPTSVGKEFARADKAKGYSTQAKINRPNTAHGKMDMPFHSVQSKSKGGEMKESKGMKKGGMPPAFLKKIMEKKAGTAKYAKGGGIESKGKTKGTMVKMAKGGRAC